ncbi:helix-turn-helix transcriptional regulator [Nonomuraea wenchangensis]|uniref:AraC-type DNA-binding protein n=1 Tax=Nonomuraea wenchangensis TaxID=568860 RepID=A0A1I0L654_9ACTN|nr:AraC family transcriptional regulator [Nonomuraea wenchangensis]SEU34929.1 AraC-type DNA-binding protein [Nonomuraea wenchangensis]
MTHCRDLPAGLVGEPPASPPPASTTAAGWQGTTMLQPGWLAFTGDVGTTEPHAHAALQVLIVTAGTVELTDAHRTRRRVRAAIIPPRARHAVRGGPGARADMLYLDPAGGAGRHLLTALTWPGRDQVSDWVTAAHALLPERAGAGAGDGPRDPAALVRAWTAPAPGPHHPALRKALDLLPELLAGPVRLTDLADAVHLSASRLGHLFTAELALPYPVYVRWIRLRRAIELARDSATLTEAAHGAGFADGSHLTRVCHEMFGLAPSQLIHLLRA